MDIQGCNCFFEEMPLWKSKNVDSVGILLCKFFLYWFRFDFTRDAVSVRMGKVISKSECRFAKTQLSVEDPFETDFNCARLVKKYNLQKIVHQFKMAYYKLYTTKDLTQLVGKDHVLKENNFVSRNYTQPRTASV